MERADLPPAATPDLVVIVGVETRLADDAPYTLTITRTGRGEGKCIVRPTITALTDGGDTNPIGIAIEAFLTDPAAVYYRIPQPEITTTVSMRWLDLDPTGPDAVIASQFAAIPARPGTLWRLDLRRRAVGG